MSASPTDLAVVVAGDAFVDLTSTTGPAGEPAYAPHPGGSCLNVAVGLGRLGVPTALLARISDDSFGGLIRGHLAASGVRDDLLLRTADLTGLAVADLDGGQAGYTFHTLGSADRGLQPAELPELPAGAALHLGSVALVQEPQASSLTALLRREAGRRLVSLDPNVRPSLIADRGGYLTRLAEWVGLSDLVKVSEEDLDWLYPGAAYADVARRWLTHGPALVVVTRGAAGAWAATIDVEVEVDSPAVTVVDTVGAGDAFTAGVLAELHTRSGLRRDRLRLDAAALTDLLRYAAEIAADTCTRAGAEPPFRAGGQVAPAPRPAIRLSLDQLVERARALAGAGRRLLGLTGPPGAGKSTIARELVTALGPERAVLVPMDGFHLANRTLIARDHRNRKGAWDTFDADGYLDLLRRLRRRTEPVVHAPDFDRVLDESIGSAVPVPREVPLVVTEGNYLLSEVGAWGQVAGLLDETWYVEVAEDTRLERLVGRHEQHGLSRDRAVAWASGSDQVNAELIAASRERADLVVTLVEAGPPSG